MESGVLYFVGSGKAHIKDMAVEVEISIDSKQRPVNSSFNKMYQIEVKRHLIEKKFPPHEGWKITTDIDAMEKGKGNQNPPEKREMAKRQIEWFENNGVNIASHPVYGRADIVAEHPTKGTFIIEVEGRTSRQKEQSLYSALGQTILLMHEKNHRLTFGIAVPDENEWINQIEKIPNRVCSLLNLKLYLVSKMGVREI